MPANRFVLFVFFLIVAANVFAFENEELSGSAGGVLHTYQTPDLGLSTSFSFWSLAGGFLFSGIGFVAFVYGKRSGEIRPMLIGMALLAYPYFVQSSLMIYLIGIGLTASLYWFRE